MDILRNEWKLPLHGGCLCGSTRFAIATPPMLVNACHCLDCQKLSASAYSLTLLVFSAGFSITAGNTAVFQKSGASGRRTNQHFCPHCHSWLYAAPEAMDEIVAVRAPMLDDASWIRPTLQLWTERRLPFSAFETPFSYPRDMPMEDVPRILAHFAENGSRP